MHFCTKSQTSPPHGPSALCWCLSHHLAHSEHNALKAPQSALHSDLIDIRVSVYACADMQKRPSSASGNIQKIVRNLKILVSKFNLITLQKYLTQESAGGRILTFCLCYTPTLVPPSASAVPSLHSQLYHF